MADHYYATPFIGNDKLTVRPDRDGVTRIRLRGVVHEV